MVPNYFCGKEQWKKKLFGKLSGLGIGIKGSHIAYNKKIGNPTLRD